MSVIAKFPSTCRECGTKISVGDAITFTAGCWMHEGVCASGEDFDDLYGVIPFEYE